MMTNLSYLENEKFTGGPASLPKPELLAPAGDLEKLRMAILYGADAVYLGGREFSLRAGAGNFSPDELAEGINFAHVRGARVLVAVNIFAHNQDLEKLPAYLGLLKDLNADGLIVADPGVIRLARELVPEIPLHLSTQANNLNWAGLQFWAEQGIKRVVLGRELTLSEIRQIREKVRIELEVFIHGAMCLAYSGRCYLSRYFNGRDANQGDCSQPCRWQYRLLEEKRPGQHLPVEQDERGTYLLSSKDLCLLPHLPDLIQTGLNSFKIEGRMKSIHYVATVVRVYRQALDAYWADPLNYRLDPAWLEELDKVSHREYTTAFFGEDTKALLEADETITLKKGYSRTCDFVGLVKSYAVDTQMAVVEQRNSFRVGETLEIIGPHTPPYTQSVRAMWNDQGESIEVARHPQEQVAFRIDQPVEPWSLVRRCNQES